MKKRDANSKTTRWRAHQAMMRWGYKVGSYFKGCLHCGDTKLVEVRAGVWKKVWVTGTSVFRVYEPYKQGFMYMCWDCGAKDTQCWEPSDGNTAYVRWLTKLDAPLLRKAVAQGAQDSRTTKPKG